MARSGRTFPFKWTQRRTVVVTGAGSTGTSSTTNANDTLAAAGTTTVTGTLATTNANDTLAAAGTTTVTGALARTNANDTLSAAGSTAVTGTLAKTNNNDTLSAAGTTTVTGAVAYTNNNDTVVAAGTTPGPAVTTPPAATVGGTLSGRRGPYQPAADPLLADDEEILMLV